MDKALLQKLSSQLKIAPEQILREYWEMMLLNTLSEQSWSASLGFKGGTALRLAYGSPRFSDDLDFSLLRQIKSKQVFTWAESFATQFALEITDSTEKRNTLLVEFRIRNNALTQPIKQKIEISKRPLPKTKNGYQLRLLSSPVTNSQVLLSVASLELLWQEKLAALNDRKEPRDLFDLWYIAQQMKRELPTSLPTIPARTLRLTLNKYLPKTYQRIVSELE